MPGKKVLLLLLCFITLFTAFAQNVTVSINATQNKCLISPYIYGKNDFLDKPVQFYKDAGLRFTRMNAGNNLCNAAVSGTSAALIRFI